MKGILVLSSGGIGCVLFFTFTLGFHVLVAVFLYFVFVIFGWDGDWCGVEDEEGFLSESCTSQIR